MTEGTLDAFVHNLYLQYRKDQAEQQAELQRLRNEHEQLTRRLHGKGFEESIEILKKLAENCTALNKAFDRCPTIFSCLLEMLHLGDYPLGETRKLYSKPLILRQCFDGSCSIDVIIDLTSTPPPISGIEQQKWTHYFKRQQDLHDVVSQDLDMMEVELKKIKA